MDLIQPRHSYADQDGQGQIYTNTSLRTAGSILTDQGMDISLHDENLRRVRFLDSHMVGLNLLGAPYIPVAMETIQRLKDKFGKKLIFVLGGQVLTGKLSKTGKALGLDHNQFKKIFGDKVYNGMEAGFRKDEININDGHTTSLIPMYKKLSDSDFSEYFTREISLYISQGCKFDCDFCAAVKGQKEQYRYAKILYRDICYIVKRLQGLGKNQAKIYMSNLDVFQSPNQLEGFADMMVLIKENNPGFTFSLRGLAGIKSFVNLDKNHPETLEKLVKAGFTSVGYGVDGMGPEIWKGIKKPQNNEEDALDAIRLSKEKYNITPELFMVFGHAGIDTEKSLKDAYEFVETMVQKYGAVPRPHVVKPFIPGNDGRTNPAFRKQVNQLIRNPKLFQSLDFTALASKLTHPNEKFRTLVNQYYLEMCKLPGNTTLPIIPYEIDDSAEVIEEKRIQNIGKFDR